MINRIPRVSGLFEPGIDDRLGTWLVGLIFFLGLGAPASCPLIAHRNMPLSVPRNLVSGPIRSRMYTGVKIGRIQENGHDYENTWVSVTCAIGLASIWLRFPRFAVKIK